MAFSIGQIVYWTNKPIALYMKPENGGNMWKTGIIVEHISEKRYKIMDEEGKFHKCCRTMIKQCQIIDLELLDQVI